GDETDEYTDSPDNFSIVSLSAITADNPDIALLLTQAEGSAWELNGDGEFQAVADWQSQE
ncbi:immunity protein Imm33 domain-containing protein, partial [Neisseria sp. P0019.S002]|uniref:immunity protein Imm33 domain-containing protein n=1 Tax=Neisseria sp. P0019.S002 TaxID=3436798 RepID=UPI003F7E2DB2